MSLQFSGLRKEVQPMWEILSSTTVYHILKARCSLVFHHMKTPPAEVISNIWLEIVHAWKGQWEILRLKLLNGMSFLLSGQLLHSWHPSTQLLIGIFGRRNGCFPRRPHRGLKSCKLFILMTGYLLLKNKKKEVLKKLSSGMLSLGFCVICQRWWLSNTLRDSQKLITKALENIWMYTQLSVNCSKTKIMVVKSQTMIIHALCPIMSHLIMRKASNILVLKFLQSIDGVNVLNTA